MIMGRACREYGSELDDRRVPKLLDLESSVFDLFMGGGRGLIVYYSAIYY